MIISSPGVYKLCENIVFAPNSPDDVSDLEDAFDPVFDGSFSTNKYGLGFFAAISITTSDVTIHLNDFTIEQSAGHALMQRFFAVIELASSPFISSVGPAQFVGEGEVFDAASNVQILGPGTIGRSSHHGEFMHHSLAFCGYHIPLFGSIIALYIPPTSTVI